MTNDQIRFSKKDIGAEILPILTSGLYRDTLDALREYVQNAIDAKSSNIKISIDTDVVSVHDDGVGMTFDQAKRAMRLGISDKNPLEDVGFRGIGIYSAFNLCNNLEIYTKSEESANAYLISFDFKQMRFALLEEQERRKRDLPPELYLEKLLEDSVAVTIDDSGVIENNGTIAILSEVLPDAYLRLNNWAQVSNYLRDVVPLPFDPDFKYAVQLQEKFDKEGYRVVPLTLQINHKKEKLYRPYSNSIFEHGGKYEPKFFVLTHGRQKYGFAWACVNDARKVIKDKNIRGLLIKKQGFSIASRQFLEPFFTRTVFSRRMVGEVIVNHPELIPNAARSDFEHNTTRQIFFEKVLPKLTKDASNWANKKQEDALAEEILAQIKKDLRGISEELPTLQRDNERLLALNVELAGYQDRLKPHARRLRTLHLESFQETQQLLKDTQETVKSFLTGQRKETQEVHTEVVRSVQRKEAITEKGQQEEEEEVDSIPKDIVELLDAYALIESDELRAALKYFDENILQVHLDQRIYKSSIDELRTFIEEKA